MVKGRQGERVRSKSNQYPNTSLIQIEGVNTKEDVSWYCGKKIAYIYKAKVKKNGTHYRCIWGVTVELSAPSSSQTCPQSPWFDNPIISTIDIRIFLPVEFSQCGFLALLAGFSG
ncbi:hypothetical protein SAY87_023131 [Trapa incisa]|uniref:Uncharacterized protein n=1 Tax=Trapa incisa TaxID=236973 RepID=A0AAN7KBC5_9MYRT|nr:hypothetical protein SAY87_023131 [Trapa incisa]